MSSPRTASADRSVHCQGPRSIMTMRERQMSRYGGLWAYKAPFGADVCTYCGDPATSTDHVAPVSYVYALNGENLPRNGMWRVPSCRDCNIRAGDYPAKSIADKRRYIRLQLRRRHKTLLSTSWTDEEIEECGYNLATFLRSKEHQAEWLRMRLGWPENRNLARRRHFNLLTMPGLTTAECEDE